MRCVNCVGDHTEREHILPDKAATFWRSRCDRDYMTYISSNQNNRTLENQLQHCSKMVRRRERKKVVCHFSGFGGAQEYLRRAQKKLREERNCSHDVTFSHLCHTTGEKMMISEEWWLPRQRHRLLVYSVKTDHCGVYFVAAKPTPMIMATMMMKSMR